jgi:Phosphohydrolase-associated domain
VVSATLARFGPPPLGRYHADLVIPSQVAAEVALLKAVALRFVMSDPHRLAVQARERELLAELCAALVHRAPEPLDPALLPAWHDARSDSARLRVIVDQVAALTNAQAVRWHAQLSAERAQASMRPCVGGSQGAQASMRPCVGGSQGAQASMRPSVRRAAFSTSCGGCRSA